ncbi:MAG TPA: pirin family protein [Candidatus Acidoferrales bacterium]|jgi:redox-sensitive bicupin YhaK (pirin superfamily)|nr:pirin family protein [Candidatus Acidoferrales bacterium]
MIEIRPSEDRGHNKISWLESRFTFSFDQYYDPDHTQFRSLRVMNEDVVAPGGGFPTHPHRDMEILTWILEGTLEHRDNTGGSGVIRPGELQHMSAGRGVMHSEFNPSQKESVHLLQIWLLPERKGLDPSYEQLAFPDAELRGKFHRVAGPEAPVTIRQDANLYIARLDKGADAKHSIASGRHAWLQVARGAVTLNGTALKAGDGAAISDESEIRVEASELSEVLLFDLA